MRFFNKKTVAVFAAASFIAAVSYIVFYALFPSSVDNFEIKFHLFFISLVLLNLSSLALFFLYRDYQILENKVNERTETLLAEKNRFEMFYKFVPCGVFTVDTQKNITGWNKAAEDITGFTADEVIGRPCSVFADYPCKERCGIYCDEIVKPIIGAECTILTKRGASLFVSKSVDVLKDQSGRIVGGIESFFDISRLKENEAEMKRARDYADEASRTKSVFVANISHEIRTPLNSILGFSELLFKSGINDDQRELLGYVKTSGQALLTLINDVLDISKIEAGKLEIESVEFDVNKIVWEVAGIVTPAVKQKALNLVISNDFDIDFKVFGDPSRLRQVLLNLLGNAVKFTEKGKISISTKILSVKDGSVIIEFVVTDEGAGIPAGKLKSIFKPFTQVDSSTTRRYGGTGLGLAISNQLVKLMGGGDILFESYEGRGSRFYFALQFSKGSSILKSFTEKNPDDNSTAAEKKAPLNFLVVEDNLANQQLLGKILKNLGHAINYADNGARAVEFILKEKYDVVLMDVQMPVMDGIAATRAARQAGYQGVVIAMTASTMKGDEQDCLDAGMDAYLSKPVDIERLESVIRGVIEKRAGRTSGKTAEKEIKSVEISSETKDLDFEKLQRNMAGKVELMSDAVEMFLEYYPKYCAEIKNAIDTKNAPALKMSAHKLKGTALNGSATAIAAMLLTLENIGKSGNTEGAAEEFEKLAERLERYKAAAFRSGLLV